MASGTGVNARSILIEETDSDSSLSDLDERIEEEDESAASDLKPGFTEGQEKLLLDLSSQDPVSPAQSSPPISPGLSPR